jgi:hypothetical protein
VQLVGSWKVKFLAFNHLYCCVEDSFLFVGCLWMTAWCAASVSSASSAMYIMALLCLVTIAKPSIPWRTRLGQHFCFLKVSLLASCMCSTVCDALTPKRVTFIFHAIFTKFKIVWVWPSKPSAANIPSADDVFNFEVILDMLLNICLERHDRSEFVVLFWTCNIILHINSVMLYYSAYRSCDVILFSWLVILFSWLAAITIDQLASCHSDR